MQSAGIKRLFFIIAILGLATFGFAQTKDSPWRFQAGVGTRSLSPVIFLAGFGYKDFSVALQGLGARSEKNDFWCGLRGSLLWTFFKELPFNFDVGIGGGYEFAKAPNKMHQALNSANKGRFLLPYNYKENADISLELWTHLYGFYTQISVPAHQFKDHDAPKVLWGAGYMVAF